MYSIQLISKSFQFLKTGRFIMLEKMVEVLGVETSV